jgi:putative ubiquitin-RnfH superfamily antitoxin RatB of RatAB toxin-antitoxin module
MANDSRSAAIGGAEAERSAGRPEPDMEVEVAYATPECQLIVNVKLPRGATAGQAIDASGIREEFPQIEARPLVGIFSRKVSLDYVLSAGDRVEIYRPLIADPKEVRRKKAAQEKEARKNKI